MTALALRPYCESDRAAFLTLVTDAALMRCMGGRLSAEAAKVRFESLLRGSGAALLCARAAEQEGAYVGHAFLAAREDLGDVELGFIVTPDRQGRGFGAAIAEALVRIAYDELGLARLIATVDEDNVASKRVLEKAGFDDLGVREDDQGPYRFFARDIRGVSD